MFREINALFVSVFFGNISGLIMILITAKLVIKFAESESDSAINSELLFKASNELNNLKETINY